MFSTYIGFRWRKITDIHKRHNVERTGWNLSQSWECVVKHWMPRQGWMIFSHEGTIQYFWGKGRTWFLWGFMNVNQTAVWRNCCKKDSIEGRRPIKSLWQWVRGELVQMARLVVRVEQGRRMAQGQQWCLYGVPGSCWDAKWGLTTGARKQASLNKKNLPD